MWNRENRLLVYYEDLMQNPKEEITKIAKFVDADPSRTEAFLNNLDHHIVASLNQKKGVVKSKGKDLIYHSKKVKPEWLALIDEAVQKCHPKYWEKYLNRYAVEKTMK